MLTDWHWRVAVDPGESVFAPTAVEPVEVPGAAARAGEEAKRPALAVILVHVRVLRPVCARVRLHRQALASAKAHAARVVHAAERSRTTARAAQSLGARALTRELRAHSQCATGQH